MRTCLVLVCALIAQVGCACDDDGCYASRRSDLRRVEDSIRSSSDAILRRYDVSEEALKDLIDRFEAADEKSKKSLDDAASIKDRSSIVARDAMGLLEELRGIDRESDRFRFDDVTRGLNSTAPVATPRDRSGAIDKELIEYAGFVDKWEERRDSLTNLPYSTSDEMTLLDSSMQKNKNVTCFDAHKRQLKDLFAKLTKLLDFERARNVLNKSLDVATDNLDKAKEILALSDSIDADAADQERALRASEETLRLARAVEELMRSIDEKRSETERSSLDEGLRRLFDKYDSSGYFELLEELRETSGRIDGFDGNEGEVDEYRYRIDRAIRYIENCS